MGTKRSLSGDESKGNEKEFRIVMGKEENLHVSIMNREELISYR